MSALEYLQHNSRVLIDVMQILLDSSTLFQLFEQAVRAVLNSCKTDDRLCISCNRGSAADAQSLAAEFVSKLAHDHTPLPRSLDY